MKLSLVQHKQERLAHCIFALSITFFVWALASYLQFDGVVVRGLNAQAGTIKHGEVFAHHLTLYNFGFYEVDATVIPTCGCAFEGPLDIHVGPFSKGEIAVNYRLDAVGSGLKKRDVVLLYKHRSRFNRVHGSVSFTLL